MQTIFSVFNFVNDILVFNFVNDVLVFNFVNDIFKARFLLKEQLLVLLQPIVP